MFHSPAQTTPPLPAVPPFAWPPFALGLAALIVVMFAPLRGGFFQYDDFILLAQAQHGWSIGHPLLFFTLSQNGLFTPLNNVLFWLEFRAFGLHPLGYECVSLVLHWANCVLVGGIAWRLTRSRAAAWAAGIAFAVGFGKLEAVTWIAAFVHLVTTLCYLASVACFLRWLDGAQHRFYALSVLLFVLGMFSKEPIVTLPLTLAAASWLYGAGDMRQRLRTLVPFFMLGALYVAGMALWQRFGPAASFLQTGVYKPGASGLLNFGALGGVLLPAPYGGMMRFLARVPHLDTLYRLLTTLAALLVAPLLIACWVRGSQAVRFGVLWVLISFLPFLFVAAGIASRYLYLPSVGFSLILAGLAEQWQWQNAQTRTRLLTAGVAAWALANMALFAVWQHQQNQNGAVRQALIRQMAALPARAPQTSTVCVANISSKFHDIDLALPLWIPHAPHFKAADACQNAAGPTVQYKFQDGRLVP